MNKKQIKNARKIQDSIRSVLLNFWDPIGICCDKNINDEYDGYIAGIYRILINDASKEQIFNYLKKSEHDILGEIISTDDKMEVIYDKLLELNVRLK